MTSLTSKAQFKRGKSVEYYLDGFFRRRGWTIYPTTSYEERILHLGDRHFSKRDVRLLVEYKSGLQTATTGNIFLETVSVDSRGIPGWVYTCKANLLLYAALLNHEILVFKPEKLRQSIEALKTQFREVRTGKRQNDTYDTHGLIVPLDYAGTYLAEYVIRVDEELHYADFS